MSEDWVDAAAQVLPHIPGFGAFGLAALALFRTGRAIGRAQTNHEKHGDAIDELKGRVEKVEKAGADLAIRIAEVPKRSELRGMFAEQREETRAMFSELREDIRALSRGG